MGISRGRGGGGDGKIQRFLKKSGTDPLSNCSFFLSLHTVRRPHEHDRRLYFVHFGLQDESLQETISKVRYGSLTFTRCDFPCTEGIELTFRSEGRLTYLVSSLQMTLRKACSGTEIFLAARGSSLGPLAPEACALTIELPRFLLPREVS